MGTRLQFIDFPDTARQGLRSGKLTRFGNILRDNRGRFGDHLKVLTPAEVSKRFGQAAGGVTELPSAQRLGVQAVQAVHLVKRTWQDRSASLARQFTTARADYLSAINDGALSVEVIDRLLTAVARFEDRTERRAANRVAPGSRPESMVFVAAEQTRRMTQDGGLEAAGLPETKPAQLQGTISELTAHLRAQRDLLTAA